jgi:hypothetical protein
MAISRIGVLLDFMVLYKDERDGGIDCSTKHDLLWLSANSK